MDKSLGGKQVKRFALKISLFLLAVFVTIGLPSRVGAQSSGNIKYNPYAEQWVSYQIAVGKVADLAQHYPNPSDRVIRGSFVLALLQNKSSVVAQHGVWIRNATITNDLILNYADISFPVSIEDSSFEGFVSFCRGYFHKTLSFNGSTFRSQVNFCSIEIDDSLFLSRTTFHDSLDLNLAEIRGSLTLDQAHFINEWPNLNFSSIQIGENIFLGKALFEGRPNFNNARIEGFLLADDVSFQNKDAVATFDSIRVNGSIYLNRANFNGPVSFFDAYIGSHFIGNDARFNNPDQNVSFENMHAKGTIHLRNAIFEGPVVFKNVNAESYFLLNDANFKGETDVLFYSAKVGKEFSIFQAEFSGPVDFRYIDIGSSLEGTSARFHSKDGLVNFGGAKVAEFVYLNKSVFSGPVYFLYNDIGKNFEAQDAQFTNIDIQPSFGYMKVADNLLVDRTVFSGSANLGNNQIAGSFSATEAQFNSPQYPASFNDTKAKYMLLNDAVFLGPVNFSYSQVDVNFNIDRSQFESSQTKADFSEMTIGKSFFMSNVRFDGAASFDYVDVGGVMDLSRSAFNNSNDQLVSLTDMNVDGYIFLNQTVFNGPVNFTRTATRGLFGSNVTWPKEQNAVNVMGMTYEEVEVSDSTGNTVSFISLLEQSPFEIQSYWRLENYYRNKGYLSSADYVYVKSQQRERGEGVHWSYWRWWWNLFLDIFVLYGLDPLRVPLWCLLVVIVGFFVFRKKEKMIAVVEPNRTYRPLLYSLDLFLPIIDLGYAAQWKPDSGRKIARIYAGIHRSLAWFLLPIAVLAIAGVFR